MRFAARSMVAACLMLAATSWVLAQEVRTTTEVRRTSVVVGAAVRLQGGVTIGKIEDIVFNEAGCIEYVVVSYEERYVLVPWAVTVVDFGQRFISIDITRERFVQVPTFTRTQWSMVTDRAFTQKVHTAFGVDASRRERPGDPKEIKKPPAKEPVKPGERPKAKEPPEKPDPTKPRDPKEPAKPKEPPAKDKDPEKKPEKKPEIP